MSSTQIVVHRDSALVAATAAARMLVRLVDVQSARGTASIVLTGGGAGTAMLEQMRHSAAVAAVDWSQVDFYWGDERFLPPGHPERNETQARAALLDHVSVDPARVHPMAADEGTFANDPDAAARAYAELLAGQAASSQDHGSVPEFDVCLLGMGEEGHVASVFPSSPAVYETEQTVVAVRNCPKPPPTRVSLTLPTIRRSAEVWLLPTGAGKAEAVALALGGTSEVELPAAGARGQRRTLWLMDQAAASKLPPPVR